MKVDFSQPVLNLDGTPAMDPAGGTGELTIGSVCMSCLLAGYNDEPNLSGPEKYARFKAAEKVAESLAAKGEVDVSVEQSVLIKNQICRLYGPLVVGRVWEAIEGVVAKRAEATSA